MKIRTRKAWLLVLLSICVVLFAGCAAKGHYISKYDVEEMVSALENPCRKYTLEECFAATTVLEEYFDGDKVDKAAAKNAFDVMNTYMDNMLDAGDIALGILINLE